MPVSTRYPFLPRMLVAAMSVLLAVVVGATYASAQASQPVSDGPVEIDGVDPDDPLPTGTSFTVSGSGFAPGATVEIYLNSDPVLLATTTADGTGSFSVQVTIPAGVPAGTHTVRATGAAPGGGIRVLTQEVEVVAATAAPAAGGTPATQGGSGGALAFTGSNPWLLALLALGLAGGGTLAVLAARQRRLS